MQEIKRTSNWVGEAQLFSAMGFHLDFGGKLFSFRHTENLGYGSFSGTPNPSITHGARDHRENMQTPNTGVGVYDLHTRRGS